jgi:nucleotide-binding universal stress UspA family protein
MLEHVLVAADLGPASGTVARVAAALAKSQRGRVHACYVVDRAAVATETGLPVLRQTVRDELEEDGRRALRRVATACRKARVPYHETLAEGAVVDELVRVAQTVRADVIAMGTQGLGRMKTFLWGSRAQELISRAPCPVLVIRQGTAVRARPRRQRKTPGRPR